MTQAAILCVDDERVVLQTLKEQLRRHFGSRFLYETACDATTAWEVIDEMCSERVEILVIVSDWLMPGIRGDEFLAQVHQRYPHIACVMLTGQADTAAIERARQDAALHACLHKPWDEGELLRTVEAALA